MVIETYVEYFEGKAIISCRWRQGLKWTFYSVHGDLPEDLSKSQVYTQEIMKQMEILFKEQLEKAHNSKRETKEVPNA